MKKTYMLMTALYYMLTVCTPNCTMSTLHTSHQTKHTTRYISLLCRQLENAATAPNVKYRHFWLLLCMINITNFCIYATKIPPLQKYREYVSIKNACYGLQLSILLTSVDDPLKHKNRLLNNSQNQSTHLCLHL